MPLQFVYSRQDFVSDVFGQRDGPSMTSSLTDFDRIVQAGWTDRMERGLFRYRLGDLQSRVLPGPHGFVAQLNVERGIERRKPQEILSIQQEFNPKQFNFNKINPDEILFEMLEATDGGELSSSHCRMVVLVNVSPLEFGHCLFVPDPSRCFPQILTPFAIQVGIESVLLSSQTAFRVGFNSLGAFASINHLHLHGYYLHYNLRIESVPVQPLIPHKGMYLCDFPAGFLFYAERKEVREVAKAVCQVTDYLVKENIAHNVFLTRGSPPGEKDCCLRRGVRIVVWPRLSCFGAKEESAFNVALCELAGHLPFKNKTDFELVTEEAAIEILQRHLLPSDEFQHLKKRLFDQLMCKEPEITSFPASEDFRKV
ncbi:GDP-D-glucose phosphorylase 1 [Gouania willdenowi]|uniref:GDP-D-glucose phosphorylase 1 n=1 Tax=Gouania willdenowi TaxID=441366 RepID=A0A8C5DMY6_GOUWI|nr:GDP-D-glucose phosphorylase 1 [Gouania willdenowi]XP_028306380.1 GDP-D-glucose phosphorylase 1 [Gouania willdenowi]